MRRKTRKKKIGEAEGSVVHCSQCGKGFSSAGLTAPHHTGFSHCKDHKGMKVIAESEDAKKYTINGKIVSKNEYEAEMKKAGKSVKEETGTKFTGYWKGKDKGRPGKKMVGDA
jgi:hypothetical protein